MRDLNWKEDKDLLKFLTYLYHHDRKKFNIIKGKLSPSVQTELMTIVKG